MLVELAAYERVYQYEAKLLHGLFAKFPEVYSYVKVYHPPLRRLRSITNANTVNKSFYVCTSAGVFPQNISPKLQRDPSIDSLTALLQKIGRVMLKRNASGELHLIFYAQAAYLCTLSLTDYTYNEIIALIGRLYSFATLFHWPFFPIFKISPVSVLDFNYEGSAYRFYLYNLGAPGENFMLLTLWDGPPSFIGIYDDITQEEVTFKATHIIYSLTTAADEFPLEVLNAYAVVIEQINKEVYDGHKKSS